MFVVPARVCHGNQARFYIHNVDMFVFVGRIVGDLLGACLGSYLDDVCLDFGLLLIQFWRFWGELLKLMFRVVFVVGIVS